MKQLIETIDGIEYEFKFEGHEHHMDFEIREENSIEISGSIKWDGCVNFDNADKIMFHICHYDDFLTWQKIFKKLYKIARDNIQNWGDFVKIED